MKISFFAAYNIGHPLNRILHVNFDRTSKIACSREGWKNSENENGSKAEIPRKVCLEPFKNNLGNLRSQVK